MSCHFFKSIKGKLSPNKPSFGDYKQSSHVKEYERIADEVKSSPQHVYEIAHGLDVKTYDDSIIWERLIQKGIVNRTIRG